MTQNEQNNTPEKEEIIEVTEIDENAVSFILQLYDKTFKDLVNR